MKIVLLDALSFGDTDLSDFEQFGDVEYFEKTPSEFTQKRIEGADVIVTNKVVITKEMMLHSPSLKLICVAATGMNNVDLEAAKELDILVKNVAGYSTDSVIQLTFSMLFYLINSSKYYDEFVKSGDWSRSGLFTNVQMPFFEIKNKKWGIIGLGTIGRGVATIAQAFGADVSYYSTSGKNVTQDFKQVSLSQLLEESDIITIHAPLTPSTKDLIGQSELLQLKDGAVLLNLGRGGIVDERALARVLEMKELKVGLDVLEVEPIKEDHPLLKISKPENLYITPHIAWTSVEAREKLIKSVIENIKESFSL